MQLSKKKISRIIYLSVNKEELNSMKKYQLLDELESYGITVDPYCDMDTESLRDIMHIVIRRVISKYL